MSWCVTRTHPEPCFYLWQMFVWQYGGIFQAFFFLCPSQTLSKTWHATIQSKHSLILSSNSDSISLFLLYHSPHASLPPSTGSKMVASPPGCNYCLVPVFKVSNFPHRIRPLLSAVSNQHQHTYAQRRILSHLHREEGSCRCAPVEEREWWTSDDIWSSWRCSVCAVLLHMYFCCCFITILFVYNCVTVMRGTVTAHVHLRLCHFWLSHEDDVMWCGVRHCCFSTQFYTCILLSVSWESILECMWRTPADLIHLHSRSCRITLRHLCLNNKP